MPKLILPCALSDAEKAKLHEELVCQLQELDAVDLERSTVLAKLKDRKTEAKERCSKIVEQLVSGEIKAPVECDDLPDYRRGMMVTRRLDTGEGVIERPLRPEERQTRLALVAETA